MRVFDNTGSPRPNALVTMSLLSPPSSISLTGAVTAVTDVTGVATFATLAVSGPANAIRLHAEATFAGGSASGTSEPFNVGSSNNVTFLQQPTTTAVATQIAPTVRVRVADNSDGVLPGVLVTMSLVNAPPGVVLSGTTSAVADVSGIASFASLAVNASATGLRLRADATLPGFTATGISDPFDVGATAATVTITNNSFIYDGLPKAVTVTTNPPGLSVTVTYNGGTTLPAAIGSYYTLAKVTAPGFSGSASVNVTIANTLTAGGPGGGPYGPRSCSPGSIRERH